MQELDSKIGSVTKALSSCRLFNLFVSHRMKATRVLVQQERTVTRKLRVDHAGCSTQCSVESKGHFGNIGVCFLGILCEVRGCSYFCCCRKTVSVCVLAALLLVALARVQDMLGRWSLIPVMAVGLCLWTKWRTRQCESKIEKDKLDQVSREPCIV